MRRRRSRRQGAGGVIARGVSLRMSIAAPVRSGRCTMVVVKERSVERMLDAMVQTRDLRADQAYSQPDGEQPCGSAR
jgi:hypothetical protein